MLKVRKYFQTSFVNLDSVTQRQQMSDKKEAVFMFHLYLFYPFQHPKEGKSQKNQLFYKFCDFWMNKMV